MAGTSDAWMYIFIFNLLAVLPLGLVLRRAGLNQYLSGLVFVPVVGLLLVLMVLGHSRWPTLPPKPVVAPRKQRRAVA